MYFNMFLVECPTLPGPAPYGTRITCNTEDDTTTCTIACREGRISVDQYPSELTCGPHTNHSWSPDVDFLDLPSCSGATYCSQKT